MSDTGKTKEQLISELVQLREQIAELEALQAERKRAEEELKESEERYRVIADVAGKAGEAIAIVQDTEDTQGAIVFLNEEFTAMLGYSPGELLNKPFLDFISLESLRAIEERYKQRQKGEDVPTRYEIMALRKDGTVLPIDVAAGTVTYRGKIATVAYWRDITEGKRVEEALRKSENRYKFLYENSPSINLIIDVDGIVKDVNSLAIEKISYAKDEIIGKPALDFVVPEDREKVAALLERSFRDEYTPETEADIYGKDGAIHTVLFSPGQVLLYEEGQLTSILVTGIDITGRKQAEEELRESEENLRTYFERAPIGITITDLKGSILYVNKHVEDMSGYKREELLGKNSLEIGLLSAKEQAEAKRSLPLSETLGIDKPIEFELTMKDGINRWVELTATPIKQHGGETAIIYFVRDITERKQAEEELTDEATRRRILIEQSRDGIVVLDQNGKVYESNQRFAEMLGFSPEEVRQLHVWDWEFQIPREQVLDMIRSIDKAGDHFETQHRRKDGTIYDVEISTNGAVFAGQKLIFCVCRDITERKQAEEERTKYTKLESIGTLAGGIAHDFNNILTGIMGNISLAKRYIEPKSKAEERLTEAEKASYRARDLTQQLLTFARGGAPVKNTVSIAGLIKESVGFTLRGSNIRCDFDLPDNLWPVEADEGQINQVITNIVINAQEAMPEGGVIGINAGNTVVQGRSTLPLDKGRYVLITIIDQGVGIRKKHLARLFDPYFTTKQKGSGLGLATSYSIIKNHGGYITVDSAPAVGTAFQIYLPASKEPSAVEKEDKAEVVTTGGGRILVMDDEEIIRELLYAELTEAGYDVELAKDGTEAIEQYSEAKEAGQPFDAVILDLTIPGGMGGKETIKKLLELDPDVKAIVSSGYATDPIMSEYKEYGFSAVVPKPYSVAQIEKTLHKLLSKKK